MGIDAERWAEACRLVEWLDAAYDVLDQIPDEDTARGERAVRKFRAAEQRWQQLCREAEAEPSAHRYPWCVRWTRQKGVLEVRDTTTGEWLQVDASACPDGWRWEATMRARAERERRAA